MTDLEEARKGFPAFFAGVVTLLHPLVFVNGFFDINHVKTGLFEAGALCAAVLLLILRPKKARANLPPLLCGIAFLLSAHLSALLSADVRAAFSGSEGRLCGWAYLFCWMISGFTVSRGGNAAGRAADGLTISYGLCAILAGLNFFHVDPLHFYTHLSKESVPRFLSTMGNVDFYAAGLCLALPLCAARFISGSGRDRLISGASLFFCSASVIWCRADGAVLALLAVAAYALIRHDRPAFAGLLLIGLALGVSGSLCYLFSEYMMPLGGCLCWYLARYPIFWFLLCALCAFAARFSGEKRVRFGRRVCIILISAAALAVTILFCHYSFCDTETPLPGALRLMRFDDRWGNYRGGVWKRCLKLYAGSDLKTRLLGLGPDRLKAPLSAMYGKEIAAFSHKTFDNAHSSLLQYLLTTGAAGTLFLIGLVFHGLKALAERRTPLSRAILFSVSVYLLHSLITVTQAETGPLFMILLFSAESEGSGKPEKAELPAAPVNGPRPVSPSADRAA